MRWNYKFPLRFRSLFRKSHVEKELAQELCFHLEKLIAEKVGRGMTPEEARYAAQRTFGNTALIKEETREMWRWSRIESFRQDLRFALRAFRKSPAFMLLAIVVLALGTGANTAIFSVFDAVLLRPLSFQDPDRVMLVYEKIPKRGIDRSDLCTANFLDLSQRSQTFATMAALSGKSSCLATSFVSVAASILPSR